MNESDFTSIGARIDDRFEVTELLGRGQSGIAVRVRELDTENDAVALKILYPHLARNATVLERFRREVLLMRKVIHPCIARVYNFGQAGEDLFYLSMEYVQGRTLKEHLSRYPTGLPLDETLDILLQVALGMSAAHKAMIIHRDLKPDNIFLTEDGRIKILDFGLARVADEQSGLTATGVSLGTPYYMSPEQFKGGSIDHRADVYSFGILAFHLALGKLPYDSQTFLELARLHLNAPIPLLSKERRDIPAWLQDLIEKCCAKNPRERFQSFAQVAGVLEAKLGTAKKGLAGDFSGRIGRLRFAQYRFRKLVDRRRLLLPLGAFLQLLVLLTMIRLQTHTNYWLGVVPVYWLEARAGTALPLLRTVLNVPGPTGERALQNAIRTHQTDLVAAMLQAGRDPDQQCPDGSLPLLNAVEYSSSAMVRLLLSRGADPNLRDRDGRLALHTAVKMGSIPIVDELLKRGARAADRDAKGNIAFSYIYIGDIKILRGLPLGRQQEDSGRQVAAWLTLSLLKYSSPDVRDAAGKTPLMYAASNRDRESLELLKKRGANAQLRDNADNSGVDYLIGANLLDDYNNLPGS